MTIQRAIKSGAPFTHPDLSFYIVAMDGRFWVAYHKTGASNTWTVSFVVSFDPKPKVKDSKWQIQDKPQPVYLTPSAVLRTDWSVDRPTKPRRKSGRVRK